MTERLNQPQPYDLFVSYAEADSAWVRGYLFDALDRGGVKYCSEETFVLGAPHLTEFERAVRQSRRTLLVLSPAYLADSFDQFANLLAQSYGLELTTWPVIPLILHPVALPPRLAILTALDATDPDEWSNVIARLYAALQQPVPSTTPRPTCPYPGMAPFREADNDSFFGRDAEIQEMLERLRLYPFLTVIGPSGSGKSSLVFAGLVPVLRRSGLFGSGEWLVCDMRPGEIPMDRLATLLKGDPMDPERSIPARLNSQPGTQRLLLVVDQFEELFSVAQQTQDIAPFQQVLLHLAATPGCYVILTVRADFYPDLMASPLWHAVQGHRLEVLPLGAEGLRQAIVRPAERVGVYVETALVERLIADAAEEPGVLPLIQETLVLLWERLERRLMPLRAYEALVLTRSAYDQGQEQRGLDVAIARYADTILGQLPVEQQTIARRIFLRLVQFGEGRADTRRQQTIPELQSVSDAPRRFEQTLAHLATNRLLTLTGQAGTAERQVDMAHEALISAWPQLHHWLVKRREAEQTRRRLQLKTQEWIRLGQSDGGLLDMVELREAETWLASDDAAELGYNNDLVALIQTSRAVITATDQAREASRQRELDQAQALAAEQRQRAEEQAMANRRLRWLATALALVALLASATGLFVRYQQQIARQQQRLALSRQLAAQAVTAHADQFDLALLLSLESNRIADTVESRGSLLTILESSPHLITFLRGHTNRVRSLAFSPDGRILAASSRDDTSIILWDMTTRQPLAPPLIGHRDEVKSLVFSPNGRLLASGSGDQRIILWDVATRQALTPILTGHTDAVQSIAFSPDGTLLASASADQQIILWDIQTRQQRGPPLIGHTDKVLSLAFSPDGQTLASVGNDQTLIIWDVATGQPLGDPLTGHTAAVVSVAFSPDGQTLASGSWDKRIILWDIATRQPRGPPLVGHTNMVEALTFSPDGQILASAGADRRVILWDVANGTLWDAPLIGHTDIVWSVAFSPNSQFLASGDANSNIILWDISTRQRLTRTLAGHQQIIWSIAFHPITSILASGGADSQIILWDTTTGNPLDQPLTGHVATVVSLAFSPDGQILASGSCARFDGTTCIQGEIRLWDVATRQVHMLPLVGHTGWVESVAFSPDSQTLVTGGGDGQIILWDALTGQQIGAPLLKHTDRVHTVAFSPDGRLLASGSADGTINLWDVTNPPTLNLHLPAHRRGVLSIAFSPASPTLASGSEEAAITLWDIGTGQPRTIPLTRHTQRVESVAFNPDGTLLASVSADASLQLWDVVARQPFGPALIGHTGRIRSVAFSPDGRMLATGGEDKRVVLWDMSLASWHARACAMAARNLTQAEWQQFLGEEPYHQTCPNVP